MEIEGLHEWTNRLREVLEEISKSMPRLLEAGKVLEEESPDAFLELSRHGWYFGYDSLPKTPVGAIFTIFSVPLL